MDYLFSLLLSYLLLYRYAVIALVSFLSGLALPLPANTLLLAAGAFSSQGFMDAPVVFFVALVSNVLGDSVGWALTRFWGTKVITETHMNRFSSVRRIEQFVRSHARSTIVVTRFIGTPGVVVNFLSGLVKVPFRKFVLYDAIGNALDIGCFILVGYVLGVYTENFSDIAEIMGWMIVVIVLIIMIIRLFLKKNVAIDSSESE